jgi:lambda family phage portal protein
MNWMDKLTVSFAPRWTLQRLRARMAAEHLARSYEAARPGRRTSGWERDRRDANAVGRVALEELRMHARNLTQNVGWARKGRNVIADHTVGWGIVPRPMGPAAKNVAAAWKAWAESTECDPGGRLTFYKMQHLAMQGTSEAGEFLLKRVVAPTASGVPLQVQVLEPDHIDTAKDLVQLPTSGQIIQGIELDSRGRRVAYWLFPEHPGSARRASVSERVPAEDVIHVYDTERAGQVRGLSWFGAAIVKLKDLDEYEDAELLKQKIAACFAAFVTDMDGTAGPLGAADAANPLYETLEPGQISYLPPGKQVTTASPPTVVDSSFSVRNLRAVAAAIGVTYEDLTGDYSQVNFSSARMARLVHWARVHAWQYHMLIPLLCRGVWRWFDEAARVAGLWREPVAADWTPPPMPLIEPAQEGLAYSRLVRNGFMTLPEVIRERGWDPEAHLQEYAAANAQLDELGIKLDSDPRATSAAGLTQERVGLGGAPDEETPR